MASNGGPRNSEQKEQILKIVQMRLDGYTLQQVADEYGVTKQCIQQKLSAITKNYTSRQGEVRKIDEKIIYPNLAKWIFDNGYSVSSFAKYLEISGANSLLIKLHGERNINMKEIKRILAFTGLPFEYLFAEKEVVSETKR